MLENSKLIFICLFAYLLICPFPPPSFAEETINLQVSIAVPERANNYPNSPYTSGGVFNQNQEITYTIYYGSNLNYTSNFTLEAAWSSSLEILDYVTGSASNGYNSVAPVVDTTNKRITWTFTNFPANTTDQKVTFKLRANSSYTGSQQVSFDVKSRISTTSLSTDYATLTKYYKYKSSIEPSPTSTPAPEATKKTTVASVEVRTISYSDARIYVKLAQASKINLLFGESSANLNKIESVNAYKTEHLITLSGLSANRNYYFKVIATTSDGSQIASDMYTFKTALKDSEASEVETSTLIITSGNNTIYDQLTQKLAKPLFFIPQNSIFQFKFALKGRTVAKTIKAAVRQKAILGVSIFQKEVEASNTSVELTQIEPGVYTGKLATRSAPGVYELYVTIIDKNGNITETRLGEIKVLRKFQVVDSKEKPIEGARIFISIYDQSENKYKALSSSVISIENPSFTNSEGFSNIVLPVGKYKANVSEIRFADKEVEFRVGEGGDYPKVKLTSTAVTPLRLARYYQRSITEVFYPQTEAYVNSLSTSIRIFDLIAASLLSILVFLTLFSFSKKTRVPIKRFIPYFIYLITHRNIKKHYIDGIITDEKGNPLEEAHVYLADPLDERIIGQTTTDKKGVFFFKKDLETFLLMSMKKGYSPTHLKKYKKTSLIQISMQKSIERFGFFDHALKLITSIFEMSFEMLIIIALAFEILFLDTFGVARTLPFLIISVFNLLLWSLYLRHHHMLHT